MGNWLTARPCLINDHDCTCVWRLSTMPLSMGWLSFQCLFTCCFDCRLHIVDSAIVDCRLLLWIVDCRLHIVIVDCRFHVTCDCRLHIVNIAFVYRAIYWFGIVKYVTRPLFNVCSRLACMPAQRARLPMIRNLKLCFTFLKMNFEKIKSLFDHIGIAWTAVIVTPNWLIGFS